MQKIILAVTLIGFSALTAVAVWFHGVWGIIEPHFKSFGAAQVFADLIIALTLFMVWMWRDAKSSGRNPWVWIILTLLTGSIAPLIYLITRKDIKDT